MLISTICASSMAFISSSALNLALPSLQTSLGASGVDLLWITNSYLLLLASLILVGGSLGDLFGRKRIFGYGIIMFTLGSTLCGVAPNVSFLIAARGVQGLGGALMVPGSLAIINAFYDDQTRGGAIGLWSAFTAATTIGGPIIGGYLAGIGFWRGVFFINIPLAILALSVLYSRVPESRNEEISTRLDWPGALLATLGLGGLTWGVIDAGRIGIRTVNAGAGIVGIALLVVFLIVEWNSKNPMLSLRLFRSPVFSGANALTFFLYAALQGTFFFFFLNLIQVQNYPESVAGFVAVPFTLLLILMSRWSGKLADRIGPRVPLIIGPALTGFGFAALALPELTAGPAAFWSAYFPSQLLLGCGMGITVAPLTSAVMGSVSQQRSGIASGISNAVSRTAGVLAIAVMGALVLFRFRVALESNLEALAISAAERSNLLSGASELGALAIPDTVTPESAPLVQKAIRLAFVQSFRLIAWIGALLAWTSALVALITIRVRPEESRRV